jgi:hypothetical protein
LQVSRSIQTSSKKKRDRPRAWARSTSAPERVVHRSLGSYRSRCCRFQIRSLGIKKKECQCSARRLALRDRARLPSGGRFRAWDRGNIRPSPRVPTHLRVARARARPRPRLARPAPGVCAPRDQQAGPLVLLSVWFASRPPISWIASWIAGIARRARLTTDGLCGRAPGSSSFCQFSFADFDCNFDRYYSIPIAASKSTGKIVLYW